MSHNPDIEFFFRQCAAHARTLPVSQSMAFMRGMMLTLPENPALDEIRTINSAVTESDHQLELIQTGQMKLDFGHGKKKSAHFSK